MARAKPRFTQAEVTKLLKAAERTGFECVTVEILPGTAGLRAIYTAGAASKEQPSELQAWIAKRDSRKRAEQNSAETAKVASTVPTTVMTDEEWSAAVKASKLSKRERAALEALVERRDRDVPINEIKGAGISTHETLEVRGFATIKKDGEGWISWRVTDEGERYLRQLQSDASQV